MKEFKSILAEANTQADQADKSFIRGGRCRYIPERPTEFLSLEEALSALEKGVRIGYANLFPEQHGSWSDYYVYHSLHTPEEVRNVFETRHPGHDHKVSIDPVYDYGTEFTCINLRKEIPTNAKYRLFVDLDGTAAEFKHVDTLETLYEKGYFLNLKPVSNVVEAVKKIVLEHPEIEVYTLSAVLTDSKYALEEKNTWINRYLPEIDGHHRLFPPCGGNKMEYVAEKTGAISKKDFLLDDYTSNLLDWEPPGTGIKVLNGINHTRGTWQSSKISALRSSDSLELAICKCLEGETINDLKADPAPVKTMNLELIQ